MTKHATIDWRAIIAMVLTGLIWLTVQAAADTPEEMARAQTDRLDTDQIERYWNDLVREYGGYFPDGKAPGFRDLIGGEGLGVGQIFGALLRMLFHEILYNGSLLVSIIILTIFSMILETMQSAFEHHTVSKIAYSISYIVLIVLAINSFYVAIGYARDAIGNMIDFMLAMIPLLLTLLASMGNVVSVSIIHPLIVFMIHTVGTLIHSVVFPLLFFSAVLHIVSSLSERYKVTQLANVLRNVSAALLGVFLTVFLGVISVQGATSAVTDGVTIRTAKYITGNFVPVVGRVFSDAADTVLGASLLVKNAVGLVGVVIIVLMCAFPAIKILTLALIYNLSAAVMQPLGESPIVTCLTTIGKSMIYIFAALASVGLMFFLAITIIITLSNVSVMIR
jgi:stage III sporulation protein AE